MKKHQIQHIVATYNALNSAKITKMDDAEKFAVIKALRKIKKIATDFTDFRKDAEEKLQGENHNDILKKAQQWQKEGENTTLTEEERIAINRYWAEYQNKVMACVKEEAEKEVDLGIAPLSEDAFRKLIASNDWTLGEIDSISEVLLD